MKKEEILKVLNELKPLVKAENEATDNWSREMNEAWHKPLAELAKNLELTPIVLPKKNADGTSNWDKIETIGVGFIVKVDD
jgi:hypothetical protein